MCVCVFECSIVCTATCVCVYILHPPSPQTTGWSALFFSAEKGDVATTQSLLKAGANAQLRDKVWYPSFTSPHSFSLSVHFTCLHLISIQNGLTPVEVARAELARATNVRQTESSYDFHKNHAGVISLLKKYFEEPATLPSHDVSRLTVTDTQ